jgi:adenine-specific DNA-methyltransferase
VRFIGSKEKLLSFIQTALLNHVRKETSCIGDLFCGTAIVSRLFKRLGYRVVANDNLNFCYVLAQGTLGINDEPQFERLIASGQIHKTEGTELFPTPYDQVLNHLNQLSGQKGFIYREYSPEGTTGSLVQRRYFSDSNAQKIDAIRTKIGYWQQLGLLDEAEECLLISDLIHATNRVANVAGTYGCFIKHWDPRAHKQLVLKRSPITPSSMQHEVFLGDANALVKQRYFDILYLDPPYTWRHYGAYYHILETIAKGDEPPITGRTGLRPWNGSKSRYCDRVDAPNALRELVSSARCKHLFLSYNSEGLISHEAIMEILTQRGNPICYETDYRRYRSNNGGSRENSLKERLYYVQTG